MQERSEGTFFLSVGCLPNIKITVVKEFFLARMMGEYNNKEPVYDVESQ